MVNDGISMLILLVKRAKLLAHNWYSGCQATVYGNVELVGKKLSLRWCLVSRYEVDEEGIEELKDKRENEITKKSM